ncbi:hypothetical protein ColTof4_00724 [Colletotrichum tofieldiae]|nr:hypothetical protein ColTof3_07937 [Colletotrichum tofieldiae]GKT68301.1 hypothetical protein ColTof4_00724 [Colletotrichum tofieldiae]GKT90690.1 hypothetical protein Ct61P_08540 [Colletotrichum tofieldiae]
MSFSQLEIAVLQRGAVRMDPEQRVFSLAGASKRGLSFVWSILFPGLTGPFPRAFVVSCIVISSSDLTTSGVAGSSKGLLISSPVAGER